MRAAILILVHKNPGQVIKLVKSLLVDQDITVFIHVDVRSTETFSELTNELSKIKNVIFTEKRHKVYWGSYNQVLATLELINCARQNGPFSYYSLISGQDLLAKPIREYKKFLSENKGKEYLAWYKLPHFKNHGKWGGLERMQLYWLDEKPRFKYFYAKTNDFVHKFQRRFNLVRKSRHELFAGANWFTLSEAAINYIDEFIRIHPAYLRSFKFTRCADEIFIQSILLNSPFKENIVNDCLRYIDWKTGPEFPRTLREEDLDKIRKSENSFFARKFDENLDSRIIEKLNTMVLE